VSLLIRWVIRLRNRDRATDDRHNRMAVGHEPDAIFGRRGERRLLSAGVGDIMQKRMDLQLNSLCKHRHEVVSANQGTRPDLHEGEGRTPVRETWAM
jgi:hypothetical protein